MITITLPWPDRRLSPNARMHYRSKAVAVKDARELAYWQTRNLGCPNLLAPGDRLAVRYTFHPPDGRGRDLDNILASCKAYQDGVFDALGLNDRQIRKATLVVLDPEHESGVAITIERIGACE